MPRRSADSSERVEPVGLRIVGGRWRGRRLEYGGELRVRPMKDRVREAVFNLLGPAVKGLQAIDLFAGTGALGLEALSRGAVRATFFEQHYPTIGVLKRNLTVLEAQAEAQIVPGNVFLSMRRTPLAAEPPWLVFCSPPYEFYVGRRAEMEALLTPLFDHAPAGSLFVIESDDRFDPRQLPGEWDVRVYPPAVVGIRTMG